MAQGQLWGRGDRAGLHSKPPVEEGVKESRGKTVTPQLQDRARKKGITWATARLWWGRAFEKMGAICDSERDGRHSDGYF